MPCFSFTRIARYTQSQRWLCINNNVLMSFCYCFTDAPVCSTDHEELFGALKHETLTLKCEVDASPPAESFHWTFNSSGEQQELPLRLQSSEVTILNCLVPCGQARQWVQMDETKKDCSYYIHEIKSWKASFICPSFSPTQKLIIHFLILVTLTFSFHLPF